MNYQQLNGKTIREGFKEFHEQNPHIYTQFEAQAFRAINKGRKKLSSKLIINWIRWNEFLRTSDKNFKINDAFQSYYARLFIAKNPDHKEVFNLRKLRNEENPPYMDVDENGSITFRQPNHDYPF